MMFTFLDRIKSFTGIVVLLILLSFLNIGCIKQLQSTKRCNIEISIDKFDTYIMAVDNFIGNDTDDEFNIVLIRRPNDFRLAFIVKYIGPEWIFIEPGESLVLDVDGERMAFGGLGSKGNKDVIFNGMVREMAIYDITPEQLKKISNANEVKCKLVEVNYKFSRSNIECFRYFYEKYVVPIQ